MTPGRPPVHLHILRNDSTPESRRILAQKLQELAQTPQWPCPNPLGTVLVEGDMQLRYTIADITSDVTWVWVGNLGKGEQYSRELSWKFAKIVDAMQKELSLEQ